MIEQNKRTARGSRHFCLRRDALKASPLLWQTVGPPPPPLRFYLRMEQTEESAEFFILDVFMIPPSQILIDAPV